MPAGGSAFPGRVAGGDLPATEPPSRTVLPVNLSPFIGRVGDLATVGSLVEAERLVTLTGAGGCGKTRLGIETAAGWASIAVPPADLAFVELAPIGSTDSVAVAIRAAMALAEYPSRGAIDTVSAAIGERVFLMVLDNCEHVVADAAQTVEALLQACPGLRVVATSREPLRVTGEQIWRVPPLELPPPDAADEPASVEAYDAVWFFLERARRARHDFALTTDNVALVTELVTRLDGMPLAIELAASQVGRLGVEQIVDGLNDRFSLLDRGPRTADPRQQTLAASMAWSYELLDDEERRTLDELSVFRGGFTLEAAAAVIDHASSPTAVRSTIGELVDKSLIQVDRAGRFSVLESVQQWGAARLGERGEQVATRDRHLAWAAALAAEAEPRLTSPDQVRWLDRLDLELDNLREAFAWAEVTGRHELLLGMAADLTFFWKLHRHLAEGKALLDRGLAALSDSSHPALNRARWSRADLLTWMGDAPQAALDAELALQGARRDGDVGTEARAVWTLGNLEVLVSSAGCVDLAERAAALARDVGDRWLLAVCLQMSALAHAFGGRTHQAGVVLDEARVVAEELRNPQLLAWDAAIVLLLALEVGDYALVDESYARGEEIGRAVADPASVGYLRINYVNSLLERGRQAEAVGLLETTLEERDACGHLQLNPILEVQLLGASDGSSSPRAEQALLNLERTRSVTPFWGALATWFQAHVAVALQPSAESLPVIQDALDQFRAIGYHRLVVDALMLMGLTEMDDDVGRAEDHFHEALRVGIDAGAPLVIIDAIDVLGVTGMLHGLDADAARLLSVAATYRAEKQLPPARWEPRLATEIRPGLEARMGPDAYAAAVAQGRTLSLDEAVALATKRRGSRSRPSVGWSSLTPAESRVVALAAEGLSNPQIADRLFIGRGTVKSHLAHAYLKLGIANRTELAAAVARRNTT